MLGRLFLPMMLMAVMAGCAVTPSVGSPAPRESSAVAVPLRTWAPSSPEACPMARTEGTLVRQPESGAGLRDPAGAVWQVIWPTDYSAHDEGGRIAVYDGGGNLLAHEGDLVEIGGQDVGGGTFLGCGGMRPIAQPSSSTPPLQAEGWGPLAVVPPQDGADTARTEGTLRITDTCVFLDTPGGRSVLVWPADRTTWDPQASTITFTNFDGSTVSAGDGTAVVLGGSGDTSEESRTTSQEWLARTNWVAPPAASCPVESWWWVGALTR